MRMALCNEMFTDRPLEQIAVLAAELGYEGLELAPFTLDPSGVGALGPAELRAARRAVERAGLEVVGLHWLLVGPPGLELVSTARDVRERTSAYLVRLAEICAELGGRVLVLGSPRQRNLAPGLDRAAGLALAASTLQAAVRRAEDLGVRWSLEPLPAEETNFLNTLRECLDLDAALGAGRALGVQLDVKSLCAEATDPTQPAEVVRRHAAHAARFAHVHANDRNRGGPGSGDVVLAPLVAELRRLGYAGWVSVEVFDLSLGPEAIAGASLAALRAAGA